MRFASAVLWCFVSILGASIAPGAPGALGAPTVPAADPTVAAAFSNAAVDAGETTTLKITLDLPHGYHTYAPDSPEGGALTLTYEDLAGLEATGALRFPTPKIRLEQLLGGMVHELEGKIVLEQDFVAKTAPGGTLAGTLVIQFCDARQCMKRKLAFTAAVAVTGNAAATPAVANDVAADAGTGAPVGKGGFAGAAFGGGAFGGASDRAQVHSVAFEPATVTPGSTVKLVIDFEVNDGYHAYAPSTPSEFAKKLEVVLPEGSKFTKVGPLVYPTPRVHLDEVLNETFHELEGRMQLTQEITIPANAKGALTFEATLSGQACDQSTCDDFDLPIATTLDAAAAAPPPKKSLLAFLLSAIGAGLLSLLMPCVFPMIPITVSVFTKQAAGGRAASVRLAAIYGISIIVVFTLIGVLCSVLLGAGGANMIGSNPWINLVLGALFVVFGLSMLGAFELRLPSFLVQRAAAAQDKATGVTQVVLMAVVFTLTSFTCTVPFVGSLLVQAATGDYTWPLLGMLAFSSTFALPFFLLALSPALVQSLPAAGGWMNTAKIAMGLVEFAFALKFFSNADLVWDLELLTRPNYLSAWVVIGLVTTLYLLGRLRVGYDLNDEPIGACRMVIALAFGWMTLYLATGFLGTRFGDTIEGLLPPSHYGVAIGSNGGSFASNGGNGNGGGSSSSADPGGLSFLQSYATALATAKAEKKPLFIDFTGITCVNCRSMEVKVFPLPEVKRYLEQFVRVQLFVDKAGTPEQERESAFNAKLQVDRFQNAAQPYYAVIDPATEETLETYPGYAATDEMVAEFVATLERAAKKYGN